MNFRTISSRLALGVAIVAVASVGSFAQESSNSMAKQGSSQIAPSDKKFVTSAAAGGMAEVELGKLATEKASSEDVKKFGQRMVDDHSKANDQLKQIASQKGISIPTDLDAKSKATKTMLEKLQGEQFDRAYMKDMVKDHQKDVAEFQKASKTSKDPDIKNFASETLPTLQDHLKEAQAVAPKTQASMSGPGSK